MTSDYAVRFPQEYEDFFIDFVLLEGCSDSFYVDEII